MPTLELTDLEQARQYFCHTLDRVREAITGLSGAQWRFKPAPDCWSIAENVEHMIIVQEHVLGPFREQLNQAPPPSAGRDNLALDAIVLEKVPDRSVKAEAPDFLLPTGQWSLPESLDRLSRNYQRLTLFVETTPDLREHVTEAPPMRIITHGAVTTMDGYQWALLVAAHNERHVRQILEVKQGLNYPG